VTAAHAFTGFFGAAFKTIRGTGVDDGIITQLRSTGNLGDILNHIFVGGDGHMTVADCWDGFCRFVTISKPLR